MYAGGIELYEYSYFSECHAGTDLRRTRDPRTPHGERRHDRGHARSHAPMFISHHTQLQSPGPSTQQHLTDLTSRPADHVTLKCPISRPKRRDG